MLAAERFSAFSFVDRITTLEPGSGAVGRYTIPVHLPRFPMCLVAEAIGQLAAWVSISHLGFRRRPVAGLAGETLFFGSVTPGQVLDLAVELGTCDEDAVAYGGSARVDGALVLELRHCVGPMLAMEEFDAPEAVRGDFETLCGPGAPAARIRALPQPEVTVIERVPGRSLVATLQVPESAPFFGDHFPRRPVFPGTLLLDRQIELAVQVARERRVGTGVRGLARNLNRERDRRQDAVLHRAGAGRRDPGRAAASGRDDVYRRAGGAGRWEAGGDRKSRDRDAGWVMTPSRRRVAITGLGLVTPVGLDVPATWSALLAGRSGVAPISLFDATGFPVRIAAEVKGFDLEHAMDDRKLLMFANRSHRFALAAAEHALRDAGIRPGAADAARWGCVVGTGMMGVTFDDLADVQRHAAPGGELDTRRLVPGEGSAADPMVFCRSQSTAGVALLLRRFGIRGYASSVHTACASGGQAVGTAMKLIRRGTADRVLTGGFDSMINPVGLGGFCLLSAVSPDNETPERASRPFDATRNGFVLGEGAGFLVLEEWESARRRARHRCSPRAGDGNSLSSYRITDSHPSGDGPIQAMRQALSDAGVRLEEVDYLNAHGTSTPMNDRSECAAVNAVFGAGAKQVAVSSTKSVMGHLIAAAGAVEAVVCALAIRHGTLPVNANLRELDPDCDVDVVRDEPRRRRVRIAMSNSLGFGGSNSCIVLRNPEEVDGRPALGD